MKYEYTYRNTASDLWQVSMSYIYGSMIGTCNIVFTAAILYLTVTMWMKFGIVLKLLLIAACLFFPVVQPLVVFRKSAAQAARLICDTTLGFDDAGMHIRLGEETSDVKWKQIKRISKKPGMLIVFSDAAHGFILMNRVLGKQKQELYDYILSHMSK